MENLSRKQLEKLVDVLAGIALDCMDADMIETLLSERGVTSKEMRAIGMEV